jgi:hypothetical protein
MWLLREKRKSTHDIVDEWIMYQDVGMHSMFGMNASSLSGQFSSIVMCFLLRLILGLVVEHAEAQKAMLDNVGGGHCVPRFVDRRAITRNMPVLI